MSNQSALRKRTTLLSELRQIVQAMKNVAFAELQRATRERHSLAQALKAVLDGLATCHELAPAAVGAAVPLPASWFVIGAERGFCGTFNARLAESVRAVQQNDPNARVLVAGQRVAEQLESSAATCIGLAGCASVEDAAVALDGWLTVLENEVLQGREVWLLHTTDTGVVRRRLLPAPDLDDVAHPVRPVEANRLPMHYLPASIMQAALQRQAVRLIMQAALCASLEQENRSRLTQMQLAHDHLERLRTTLRRRQALQRQADITNELETLTSVSEG